MGMELFELAAKVALDKGDFDKGVQEADDSGKALADNLSKYFEKAKKVIAGLFTVAAVKKAATAVWDLAKTTSAAGDRIDKVSQSIGFSRKKFQEWDYILSQNGASIDDLGLAMKTLDQAIVGNSAEASAAFSKLGLSAAHLASLSPEEQFEKVVKALQKMPDGADKSRIALQLFGKNAQSLMPLLNSSADSVEELRQRAHDLGLIMSDEDVDASVAFGDALDDLNKVWSAVQMKFGAKILPMLTKGLVNVANLFGKLANAVQDALVTGNWGGVFDVIKNAIHWPTWPEVRDAAIRAWEGIKEGALSLAGLVFGKKEDGTVDWPDWGTVVEAATSAWNAIKTEALNLAGLVFGKKEDGSVAWPEWSNVEAAALAVWAEIKKGAENLAGLVFGRKEDGTVAWPEWDDIVEGAVSLWNDIVSFVANIATEGGKLIFGVNEDGEVNWPTLESLIAGATDLWNSVLSFVANIGTNVGKLIFGINDDGEVNWPSLDSLIGGAVNLWGDLISFVANIGKEVGKLVFGANEDGEVNWPSLESLTNGAADLWRGVLSFVTNIGTNVGKLIFGANESGEVNWPDLETLKRQASDLWEKLVGYVKDLPGKFADFGDQIYKAMMGDAAEAIEAGTGWSKIGEAIIDGIFSGVKMGSDFIQRLFLGEDTSEGWVGVGKKIRGWIDEIFNSVKEIPDADPNGIGGQIFSKIWEGIEGAAQGVGDLLLGLLVGDMTDKTTGKAITTWKQYFENIFADFSIADVLKGISGAWEELWNTITGKAINILAALIGTDGEGQEKLEKIKSTIEGIKPAIEFLLTYLAGSAFVGAITKAFGVIEGALNGSAFSKVQLLIMGLSSLFVMMYEHKDEISSFLNDVRKFLDIPTGDSIPFDPAKGFNLGDINSDDIQGDIAKLNEWIAALNKAKQAKAEFDSAKPQGYTEDTDHYKELQQQLTEAQRQWQKLDVEYRLRGNAPLFDYYMKYAKTLGLVSDEWLSDLWNPDELPLVDVSLEPSEDSAGNLQSACDAMNLTATVTLVPDASGLDGHGSSGGGNFGGGGPPLLAPGGNVFYMNAKGDSYVPYDNYPALLHRGEAVLTADQARNWRNGRPDGINADMLYNAVAEAVAAAVGSIQVNMDGAAVGNMVTNQVSRNMYRKQAGRRYGVG